MIGRHREGEGRVPWEYLAARELSAGPADEEAPVEKCAREGHIPNDKGVCLRCYQPVRRTAAPESSSGAASGPALPWGGDA